VDADGLDKCDERRSVVKDELQPIKQHEEDSRAVHGLVALPKELQLLITKYVSLLGQPTCMKAGLTMSQMTSTNDKKSLCLTCEGLLQLMTPFLYRDMRMLASSLDARFAGTLTTAHHGLPHIRTLRVIPPASLVSSEERMASVNCLVSMIPRNSLSLFQYDRYTPLFK